MPEHRPVILIPARMGSSRLPGKPLCPIKGEAMIVHVWRIAHQSGIGEAIVVCGEESIARAVRASGGRAQLQSGHYASGTDRIAAAAARLDPDGVWDPILNLQGDMPVFDPDNLPILQDVLTRSGAHMATLAFKMNCVIDRENASVVKVDVDWQKRCGNDARWGYARDFNRVPFATRDHYHHIGVYAYRRDFLDRFSALPVKEREQDRRLEQMRALDNGFSIAVGRVAPCAGGVDTREDLERITHSEMAKPHIKPG